MSTPSKIKIMENYRPSGSWKKQLKLKLIIQILLKIDDIMTK